MKKIVLDHLDEFFDDAINISREIRKANLTEKTEEAILKNFQKITENILVATKRASKEIG